MNKRLTHGQHTAVCIIHVTVDNAAPKPTEYQLNARKSVDRDEP